MALQFITKKFRKRPNYKIVPSTIKGKELENIETVTNSSDVNNKKDNKAKNNKKKQKDDMIDRSQISTIEDAVKNMQPEVKVVKKDRGLIERTESSKIIITEDNRQVLND